MAGYFETLERSYGAEPSRSSFDLPWTPEQEEAPALEEKPVAPGASAVAEPLRAKALAPPPEGEPEPDGGASNVSAAPTPERRDPRPHARDATQSVAYSEERVVERLIDDEADSAPPAEDGDSDRLVTEVHETNLFQTQHHHHLHVQEASTAPRDEPQAPSAPVAVASALEPSHPAPTPAPDETDGLPALEARLADALSRLHRPQVSPPATRIEPADFEVDDRVLPPGPATETIREVTREVVREVHHHHHETRIEAPRRLAPRTAEEASRIGRIRFGSPVWNGGRE